MHSNKWILFSLVIVSFRLYSGISPIPELEPLLVESIGKLAPLPISLASPMAPGGLVVIDGEQLRSRQLYSIEDTLRSVPGVWVRSQFSGTSQAWIIVRGFGLSGTPPTRGVRLLQDGIPMTLPDGQFLPQNIDYRTISSIEVFRGPSSLYNSVSMLGGALNFNTLSADNSPSSRFRAEAGSYDTFRWHGSKAWMTSGFDVTLAGTHASQKGFRSQNHEDAEFFSGNAGWRVSDDSEVRLFLNYSDVEGELSGPLSLTDWASNPRGVRFTTPNVVFDQPFRDLEVCRAALRYQRETSACHTELLAWLLYSDFQVFRPRATEGLDFVSTAPGVRGLHHWSNQIAGMEHAFMVGGECYGEWRPTRRVQLDAGKKGKIVADHEMRSGMAVLTLQDAVRVDEAWMLRMTLQPQHHWRVVSENFNGVGLAEVDLDEGFTFIAGRAEMVWSLSRAFGVWAALSYQEEPPILDDLVGASAAKVPGQGGRLVGAALNQLDQQSAWTGEIGARGEWGMLQWDWTFFRSRVSNEIIRTRPPAGPDVTLNAYGDVMHQGVEASTAVSLWQGKNCDSALIRLLTTFHYDDFRFDRDLDFGNRRLPAVPVFFMQAELLARHPGGWFAGLGIETAPDGMYVDYANTVKTPGYTVCNVRAGRQVLTGLSFFVSLENLFDEQFVNSVSPQSGLNNSVNHHTAAVFSGQGRRWSFGMEWVF